MLKQTLFLFNSFFYLKLDKFSKQRSRHFFSSLINLFLVYAFSLKLLSRFREKTMTLPKSFEPKNVEFKQYHFWKSNNFFSSSASSNADPYCIVIPPPNVTGVLHMGHALVNVLQDILIRWKRMKGYAALWIPGTDHAGIATQTVVERHLIATTGKRRIDFSREEFLSHVWQWKKERETRIIEQLKFLGCSCDWERLRFTMDEGCNRAVRTMFKKMFDENLIYKDDYLVNWDPVTQTALADDEVEYEERQSYLWHFRYPLADASGFIVIATTRPETMLGDTAVAVSPKDKRNAHLIGKEILLPLTHRKIPIIADNHVDPEFGTGLVKVTPAHDPNDYQMGIKHELPFINIMTPDGKINENGGKFQGMSMLGARKAIVARMKDQGLLEKTEPYTHRVGISYRSKATIEPFLSKQWFVRMSHFSERLKEIVTSKQVKIIPKTWESTYFHWINNLRDWCISRQLWWGHRIPIWYNKKDPEKMICYDGEGLPPQVEASPDEWVQDEDVLDTWFSSALWPFSSLGWPEKTQDLTKFYPNAILVTGHDILFFWVARMLLMGDYTFKKVPFPEVFLHGLIYGKSYWRKNEEGEGVTYVNDDERLRYDMGDPIPKDVHSKWEKMSKSKGNIIDPLDIITQYGTDAMRMALCASSPQSSQIDLDRRRFEEFKNFSNKLWNGARFIFMNLEENKESNATALTEEAFSKGLDESLLTLEDKWILSTLNERIQEINKKLSSYDFDQAATAAYDFFWKEFCAYYLEINKPFLFSKEGSPEIRENKQKLLVIVLCNAIRLIHPMAPFITEEIFQLLKDRFSSLKQLHDIDPYTAETIEALEKQACIVSPYPRIIREKDIDPKVNHTFKLMEDIVYTIRNIRGEMKLPPGMKTDIYITIPEDSDALCIVKENKNIISSLIKVQNLEVSTQAPTLSFHSSSAIGNLKIDIPLPKELQEQEKKRLNKEFERLSKALERTRQQLSNKDFMSKAPKSLIEKQKNQLKQTEMELSQVEKKLSSFSKA